MHETRYDWLADRWVIFAPNREERPNEFKDDRNCSPAMRSGHRHGDPSGPTDMACPFCFGSERETPDPTLVLPLVDTESSRPLDRHGYDRELQSALPRWRVRVVPNKFPAIVRGSSADMMACVSAGLDSTPTECLVAELPPSNSVTSRIDAVRRSPSPGYVNASHLFRSEYPSGSHEVIIESPHHVDSLASLPADQIELVLQAYRLRLLHWRAQQDLQYAVIFKNYGADAGASLSHSHSQLICLDFTPSDIERTQRRLVEHYESFGECYICQVASEENRLDERIVLRSQHFLAICPFASRFPYAFSIIPTTHRTHFEEITSSELKDLAHVLKVTLQALERAQPSAAYNYVLQTSPFHRFHPKAHHWRLRVIPRMSKVAGFEWGSDCYINTIKPESAAQILREHL